MAAQPLQRGGLDAQVGGLLAVAQPEPAGEPGQRRALDEGVDDDQDEDDVEDGLAAGDVGDHRDRRQDDGHRTAQTGPGQQGLLPPGNAERQQAQQDRQRTGHEGQDHADDQGRDYVVQEVVRGDQQAQQDEHADLADPAEPLGEAAGGRGVRQFGVAEDDGGQIDGEEARAVGQGAGRVGGDGDGHDGDRVEAGGGQCHMPHAVRAEPADGQSDGGADGQLQGYFPEQGVPVLDGSGRGERHDQDDHRCVVEARFGLQDTRQAGGQRHIAQDGEDRGRVRRGDHRADQQRLAPVEPGQIVRARRGDPHAHRNTDRREHRGLWQRRLDLFPLRAQAALREDDDKGRVAQQLGQLGVVEDDAAEAVLPYGDAYPQVDEQAGEPAARGEPYRGHGDEQYERADQQEFVEMVDSQEPVLSRTGRRGPWAGYGLYGRLCPYDPYRI